MDDIFEHRIRITQTPFRFQKAGEYQFRLQQIMREDPLQHVLNVGLRVEKSKVMKMLLKRKLAIATTVYWFLLLYIIAALLFWFFSLLHQNQQMTHFKLMQLKADDPAYLSKVSTITEEERKKEFQYIGEGTTFLALILVCAGFLYRSVRRQFKMAQQQQNFMMAITHELKTPIAIAKLNLETLLKHKLDEPRKQKIIQMTLQETNRLNTLPIIS